MEGREDITNVSPDTETVTGHEELLSQQIAELVTVNSTIQEEKLNDEIEKMLQKISEFVEVVEMIRSDTNICVNSILPLITEKSRELQTIFDRIDALEAFVGRVSQTLSELESQADVAESHFNTFNALKKKIFGAISSFGKKHTDTSPRYHGDAAAQSPDSDNQFKPVEIFSTSDYFTLDTQTSERADS